VTLGFAPLAQPAVVSRRSWGSAARGVTMGRPPKLTPHEKARSNQPSRSRRRIAEVGRNSNVSAATISRLTRRAVAHRGQFALSRTL
jgi:hypothetical protein